MQFREINLGAALKLLSPWAHPRGEPRFQAPPAHRELPLAAGSGHSGWFFRAKSGWDCGKDGGTHQKIACGACKPCPRRFKSEPEAPFISPLPHQSLPICIPAARSDALVPFLMSGDVIRPSRSLPRSPREAGTQLSFRESY